MKDIYLVLFEKIEIWSIQKQALFLQQITKGKYHKWFISHITIIISIWSCKATHLDSPSQFYWKSGIAKCRISI